MIDVTFDDAVTALEELSTSVEIAAIRLGISERDVRDMCALEELRAEKLNGVWFIEKAALLKAVMEYEERRTRKRALRRLQDEYRRAAKAAESAY
jgi:hypothetical protein